MLFGELAAASGDVAATSKRNEKVARLAAVLSALDLDDVPPAIAFLTGTTTLGRVGVGWAALSDDRPEPAATESLTIADVDRRIAEIESLSGDGSAGQRRAALRVLFSLATSAEQGLLAGVLGGELRQGAGDGVMTSAVAAAAGVPVAAVRRAAMFAGDLGTAAVAALTGGVDALDAIELVPGRAVQPMLASTSTSVGDALAVTGRAAVDWKLDGVRVQAHRRSGDVRLYTRNLNEVTSRLPAVVADVESLPGGDLVLDGEVMGVATDGSPLAFQDTVGDFAADAADEPGRTRGRDLRAYFFDVLYADDRVLVDEPLSVRRSILEVMLPAERRPPSIVTDDPDEATAFFETTVAAGHEGVMVKGLDAPYEAGRRGAGWRKVKPVHTLDLVVLAVEWGSGRRRGWLSNIHLGARADATVAPDDAPSGFVMVGKTFKGMTDEMLAWQTRRFTELRFDDDEPAAWAPAPWERARGVVRVRPEQVVEIAVDGVQRSTTYPGGVALRFARVRGYRRDKGPDDADTISAVRALA